MFLIPLSLITWPIQIMENGPLRLEWVGLDNHTVYPHCIYTLYKCTVNIQCIYVV